MAKMRKAPSSLARHSSSLTRAWWRNDGTEGFIETFRSMVGPSSRRTSILGKSIPARAGQSEYLLDLTTPSSDEMIIEFCRWQGKPRPIAWRRTNRSLRARFPAHRLEDADVLASGGLARLPEVC